MGSFSVTTSDKKKDDFLNQSISHHGLQGKCLDQVNVSHNHAYQQVELNQVVPKEIETLLEKLQKALHEVHTNNL